MERPYHSYLFFYIANDFYQQPADIRRTQAKELVSLLNDREELTVIPYVTLGLKTDTTFMIWVQSKDPLEIQNLVRDIMRAKMGQSLRLSYSYFGILRPSTYSGRTGKPEQEIRQYTDRKPYLILYPFTKTNDWYLLDFENRRSIMGQHIKTGVARPEIRQCLLYSYGVDDQEFLVSYETDTLESFQDLIIAMRSTIGRKYTLADTPIFSCTYMTLQQLEEWL